MTKQFGPDDWKNLTLKQKIGQTIIHMPDPESEKEKFGSLENFLKENPVSGIFSLNRGGENLAKDLLARYKEYLEASEIPLIQVDDMEFGAGSNIDDLTPLPHAMALGAAASEELAYRYGISIGKEARCAGVTWAFSNVVDLSVNPINPITNHRAVSDNPDLVARMVSQVVKGMQENGVAGTLKHFPGDGVDFRDHHLCTSRNSYSKEDWLNNSGKAFQKVIDSGVYSIMPGHITLPAFQQQKIDGLYPPATLSHELLTTLLKGEMGFEGVIVSDALVMSGFKGYYTDEQADIEAFKAGCDVLLWSTPNYVKNLEKAIENGEVSMERLDDAVSRVWNMKYKLGMFNKDFVSGTPLNNEISNFARNTARDLAEKSITLLRDKNNLLPLNSKKHKKILLVGVANQDKNYKKIEPLKEELEARGMEVTMQKNLLFEQNGYVDNYSHRYDLLIYVINRYPHHPIGSQQFWGDEAESIWAINSSDRNKTIVISLGNPYYLNEYFEAAHVYINTYSYVPASLKALARALFGEIPFQGKSPVDLSMDKLRV
jgi:beta-N-acetylhexosaminidase